MLLFNVGASGAVTHQSTGISEQKMQQILASCGISDVDTFDLAIANEDKIIEMLKKSGVIPNGATEEQIQQIYRQFVLGSNDVDKSRKQLVSKEQKQQNSLNKTKVAQLASSNISNGAKVTHALSSAPTTEVNSVQQLQWNGQKRTDNILVIRMEYSDYKHSQIQPNESPMYYADYSDKHYIDMLFGTDGYTGPHGEKFVSMKQFYEAQSGGSYSVEGAVTPWYTAKENAAYYGANSKTSHNIHAKDLIKEALDAVAKDPSIDLSKFDQVNRATGELKPDGILDHVIVIHAGVGEEAGGGQLGTNAIWSHRSALGANDYQITDSNGRVWMANDYTTEPEDGAAGVFCHEYGHDLGLPDEYDTIYSGPGEAIGYWSIMSSGSWVGIIGGTEPSGFSPYAKEFFQATLGGNWQANRSTVHVSNLDSKGLDLILDEASSKGTNNNAVRINLPNKEHIINSPASGTHEYYSTNIGTPLSGTYMTKSFDLTGKAAATLKFKTWYDIEQDWDYAAVQVREVGTTDWTTLANDLTTTADEGSSVFINNGITGSSYDVTGNVDGWVNATFDLTPYAGKNVELRFLYVVDEGTYNRGFYVDDIAVEADGVVVLSDNVEGTPKFDLNGGFKVDTGIVKAGNYYLVEWRTNSGMDAGLGHIVRGNITIAFDPGMLVWYVDEFYDNNWTGIHPGEGYLGIVDADQNPLYWRYPAPKDPKKTKLVASQNYQLHDAAFSLRKSSNFSLSVQDANGVRTVTDENIFMHPFFSDNRDYSDVDYPYVGRKVPNFGLKIYVTGESKDRTSASIRIKK